MTETSLNYQIVIAGVGGQGVLFTSRLLTEAARGRGLPVIGSETHGMSQRGGSVAAHLKLGRFWSPLVADGEADLLLGLDPVEAHRALPCLRAGSGALCVVNASGERPFPDPLVAPLLQKAGVTVSVVDADRIALGMDAPLLANLIVLGHATTVEGFPFTFDEICAAMEAVSAPALRERNRRALERGRHA